MRRRRGKRKMRRRRGKRRRMKRRGFDLVCDLKLVRGRRQYVCKKLKWSAKI